MSRLIAVVEGQTEENFVNQVLAPHLYDVGYTSVRAALIGNARLRSRRGGIRSWDSARNDIVNFLVEDQRVHVTTMVDFYGMPDSWPGRQTSVLRQAVGDKAAAVEQSLLDSIAGSLHNFDARRFIPYVVMHEFEGLLFSDPAQFATSIGESGLSQEFQGNSQHLPIAGR